MMRWILWLALQGLIANGALAQSSNQASGPAKPACSEAEFRQLDFWVGDWDLWYDQGPDKPRGKASNRITKNEFGNCVITEHFSMPGFSGSSFSIFHKPVGKWRQTWVDDQGGYYDLIGGPAPKGAGYDFALELVHPEGVKAPYLRMIWQVQDEDHLTWRWQSHKSDAKDWRDNWVLHYVRKGSQ